MPIRSIEREWYRWLDELNDFRKQYGHCRVPPRWVGIPGLSTWVSEQRTRFHELDFNRLRRLYEFGFDFGADRYWISRFLELVDYKAAYGHCNVPVRWKENPQFGNWLSGQRLRQARLPVGRRILFDIVGLDWNPMETTWNRNFERLSDFRAEHGHCNVPGRWTKNPSLGTWVGNVRHRPKQQTQLQRRRLNQLGFDWSPAESAWLGRLTDLKDFKNQHGHCDVPARHAHYPGLGSWVAELRTNGQAKLSTRRRRQLKALDFNWAPIHEQGWERRFSELLAYKRRFGHCLVSTGWSENHELGEWVSTQRTNQAKLSAPRRQKLSSLGFVWRLIPMSPRKTWDERFRELQDFTKRFGHCEVPMKWPENPPLALWVRRQKGRDKKRLSRSQFERLSRLGLQWTPREHHWEQMFKELAKFQKTKGHCNVPRHWPQNPALRGWALRQRYRKDTLSPERIRKLDALGFRCLGPRRGKVRSVVSGRFVIRGGTV